MMHPLLLLLTPTPPARVPANWSTVWCGLTPPSGLPVAPLCRALYNAEDCLWSGPVALTTTLPLPERLLSPTLPGGVIAFLDTPDSGTLYFPDIRLFRRCARDAIRAHNPAGPALTLEDAWRQVLLLSGG
ncbi:TPA: hypothetical protein P8677_004924 [Klebsiella pneumoniae]|nr:hypothetical protein [Klebsiella pneumoniae]